MDGERLLAQYRTMRRIRAFENQAETMAREGKVTGAGSASIDRAGGGAGRGLREPLAPT